VLSARGSKPRDVQVLLDGEPLRRITVRDQRLYPLLSLPEVADISGLRSA
jgi:hypothetical protein